MRGAAFAGLFLLSSLACARSATPPAQLQTITVTGEQRGPGLWKVSKGDHVLWILGTVSPLPRDIQWKSKELDERIAQSQELIVGEGVGLSADAGFFGTLALLPSLIGVKNNPDGKTLDQVLPPELYARWVVAKRKYIGHSNWAERLRPVFAAIKLYDAAMDDNHLTDSDFVRKQVRNDAKRAHLAIVTAQVNYTIKNPRAAVKRFKASQISDVGCFSKTLDSIDMDLVNMTARANAWAVGDIDALRKLPQSDQWDVCTQEVSESGIAHELGLSDAAARLRAAWLDEAKKALDKNASTVAVVSMRSLLDPNGKLAQLKALGYTIEAPDGDTTDQQVDQTATALP